jgi:hypothetical protein
VRYDSLGRMKQQIDANGVAWDFYRATYRNEVQPPAQIDPSGNTKRYGSCTWANPYNRTATTWDGLIRRPASTTPRPGRSP